MFCVAPEVKINGNFTLKEGESLELTCDYDSVYPEGQTSIFYYGELEIALQKVRINIALVYENIF